MKNETSNIKIGLDIDDTICNSSEISLKYALEFDKTLRNTGIVDEYHYITRGMFDWSKEEIERFSALYFDNTALEAVPYPGVKEAFDKWHELGYQIILISARNEFFSDAKKVTEEWLKKNNLKVDKLYVATDLKDECAVKEGISIYIDDIPSTCKAVFQKGIPTVKMYSRYTNNDPIKNIPMVSDFKEFVSILSNMLEK